MIHVIIITVCVLLAYLGGGLSLLVYQDGKEQKRTRRGMIVSLLITGVCMVTACLLLNLLFDLAK